MHLKTYRKLLVKIPPIFIPLIIPPFKLSYLMPNQDKKLDPQQRDRSELCSAASSLSM